MGRDDAKSYLPYVASKTGAYRSDAEIAQLNYYAGLYSGETVSYVQKDYEASPLNRVLTGHNVGKVFRDNGKGLLAWVVPPMAMNQIVNGQNYTKSNDITENLCYMYIYDGRNRVVGKCLPGVESIYMIYDNGDRVIAMQDGNNRADGKWIVSQHDNHNRIVKQWYTSPSELNGITAESLPTTTIHAIGYAQLSESDITSSYLYDDYANIPVENSLSFATVDGVVLLTDKDDRVRSYKIYDKIKVLGADNTFVERAYYYDYKGRVIQTVEKNQYGAISRTSVKYDFIGNILAQHESHKSSLTAEPDVLYKTFVYDHRCRLLSESAILSNGTNISAPAVVNYEHDELGKLHKTIMGSSDGAVTTTDTYNMQGWLTQQKSDLFESKLRYYNPLKATASYTGNISEWEWDRNNHTDDIYAFSYDKLSHLTEADHYQKTLSDAWGTTPLNAFAEKGLTYDLNSNIKSLRRYSNSVLTDDLSYNYSGNLINTINNSVNNKTE